MTWQTDRNGLGIGLCSGLGWVTVELNGYGTGHSREEVIDACMQCLAIEFGNHRRWKPIITEPDRLVFENVRETNMRQWERNDRVRVLECPSRPDWVGRTGFVVDYPAIGANPVLRVRLDPAPIPEGEKQPKWEEVDGTSDKFERLSR